MSRPAFPATVREGGTRILRDGYRYVPPANVEVSNPGTAEKRRPKSTARCEERTVPLRLPWSEWLIFKDFVREDLADGVLRFDWQPPEESTVKISKLVIQDGRPYPEAAPGPGGHVRVIQTLVPST